MDIGSGRGNGVNRLGRGVDANVRLHTEDPLVALANLMQFGVTTLVLVLCRARRADKHGVDESALADFATVRFEVFQHVLEQSLAAPLPQ